MSDHLFDDEQGFAESLTRSFDVEEWGVGAYLERQHPRGRGGKWEKKLGGQVVTAARGATNTRPQAPTAASVERLKSGPSAPSRVAHAVRTAATSAKEVEERIPRAQRLALKTGLGARNRKAEFHARLADLKPGEEMVMPGTHIHAKRAEGRFVKQYDVWDAQTPRGKRRIVGLKDAAQEVQERHQFHHDFVHKSGKEDPGTGKHIVSPDATTGDAAEHYESGMEPKKALEKTTRRTVRLSRERVEKQNEKLDQANPIPVSDYGPEGAVAVLNKAGGAVANPALAKTTQKVDVGLVGNRAKEAGGEQATHGLSRTHGAHETISHLAGKADPGTGVRASAAHHLAQAAPHVGHGRHRAALAQAARVAAQAGGHEHIHTAVKLGGHVAKALLMSTYERAVASGNRELAEWALERLRTEEGAFSEFLHPRGRGGKWIRKSGSTYTETSSATMRGHDDIQQLLKPDASDPHEIAAMKKRASATLYKASVIDNPFHDKDYDNEWYDSDRPEAAEILDTLRVYHGRAPVNRKHWKRVEPPMSKSRAYAKGNIVSLVAANLSEAGFSPEKHRRGRDGRWIKTLGASPTDPGAMARGWAQAALNAHLERTKPPVEGDPALLRGERPGAPHPIHDALMKTAVAPTQFMHLTKTRASTPEIDVDKLRSLPDGGTVVLNDGIKIKWVPAHEARYVTGEYTQQDGYSVNVPSPKYGHDFVKNAEDVPASVKRLRATLKEGVAPGPFRP